MRQPVSGQATAVCRHQSWLEKATVRRQRPLWAGPDASFDWRFPYEMKPLLAHPELVAQRDDVRRFVHVQAFHKYLHDVCLTETDVVNRVSTDIAYGRSAAMLPPDIAAGALEVIVDEGFHSLVARHFSLHITRVTGIAALPMPQRNPLVVAYEDTASKAGGELRAMSRLLCCCLSESTFTKEILAASRLDGYDPAFRGIMLDHLADEGRHYGYFREVLTLYWEQLTEPDRQQAAALLPDILHAYFDDSLEIDFDRKVFLAAGIAPDTADRWLVEVAARQDVLAERPRLRNAIEFLALCGVLQHAAVRESLEAAELMAR